MRNDTSAYHSSQPQEVSPLSIDHQAEEENLNGKPLDERILELVAKSPDKVYPTRLVTELGLSHEDASAELCGLLSAVGAGSSFHFEVVDESNTKVMCFSFPHDFQARAKLSRAKHEWKETLWKTLTYMMKILKIITAFGLILSLLIVTVAAMVGLLAAVIAMSRAGNDRHRNELLRRVHHLFFSMRQLLWCYAMFGHHFEGQDPFLSEIAYDLSLMTSICCGSPGSIWFWWRAEQLSRRRRYMGRSWGRLLQDQSHDNEGIAIRQERRWDEAPTQRGDNNDSGQYRGMLSFAVEFLFGPVPFDSGPSDIEKWKLRAAVIMHICARNGCVSIKDLAPYVDDPPASLNDNNLLKIGVLAIVTHFHGIPNQSSDGEPHFIFPELVAESKYTTDFEEVKNSDNGTWQAFLYEPDVTVWSPSNRLPSSLQERRYRLTMLGPKQFLQCVVLGSLNFIGVWWLSLSLNSGGVLYELINNPNITGVLRHTIIKVLRFYSILFFVLPFGRLLLISAFNFVREKRNRKRADFAHALSDEKLSTT